MAELLPRKPVPTIGQPEVFHRACSVIRKPAVTAPLTMPSRMIAQESEELAAFCNALSARAPADSAVEKFLPPCNSYSEINATSEGRVNNSSIFETFRYVVLWKRTCLFRRVRWNVRRRVSYLLLPAPRRSRSEGTPGPIVPCFGVFSGSSPSL